MLALAGLYYAGAKTGYLLEFSGPVAAIVWLPVGVGVSFLYLAGIAYWPGVVIGDLLANQYSVLPLGSAFGQTCGNVLEVLIATLLLRRLVRHGSPLASVRGVGAIAVSVAAGAAVSATVGATSLLSGGVVAFHEVPTVWRTWWLGDATGALLVVPLALAWYRPLPRAWPRGRWLEASVLLAATLGLADLASRSSSPVMYLVFPVLMWAALRFGQRGATLGVAITAVFTVWNTTHYIGPFHFHSVTRSVLNTQLFIAVAVLSTLGLAAVVTERERFAARLAASRSRLISASDNARRRLEHDLHDGAQLRLTWLALRLHDAAVVAKREPERAPALLEEAGERAPARDRRAARARARDPSRGAGRPRPGRGDQEPRPALEHQGQAARAPWRATRALRGDDRVLRRRRGDRERAEAFGSLADRGAGERRARRTPAGDRRRRRWGAAERPGSGLEGLRDRAEASGGTMELFSPPGGGTRIRVVIPASTA